MRACVRSHCDSLILILLYMHAVAGRGGLASVQTFNKTFLRYLKAVENLSNEFTGLVAGRDITKALFRQLAGNGS